jgi:hypothetical protein
MAIQPAVIGLIHRRVRPPAGDDIADNQERAGRLPRQLFHRVGVEEMAGFFKEMRRDHDEIRRFGPGCLRDRRDPGKARINRSDLV